jgi:peptidoglycan/LPS O-acetylase OafA/YrhL
MLLNTNIIPQRLVFFDIARFFAIFGVIAVHVGQNSLPSLFFGDLYNLGRFGVQLFFVISGATVYLTYSKKSYVRNNLLIFYIKRFFRIVPLFIVMAILYFFLDDKPFVQSILPWNGINPEVYNNIEGGWSIWNEMYFYILFPLYFKFRTSRVFNVILPLLFVTISILINVRFFGLINDSEILHDYDYLNFFTQFICFVIGVEFLGKNYFNMASHLIIYFFLGFIVKYIFFNDLILVADHGASYWTPLISIACLGFIISIKSIINYPLFKHLEHLSFLGQKTYTTYLIHFLVIRLLKGSNILFIFEIQLIIVAILSFVITLLIDRYTEQIWSSIGHKIIEKYQLKSTL